MGHASGMETVTRRTLSRRGLVAGAAADLPARRGVASIGAARPSRDGGGSADFAVHDSGRPGWRCGTGPLAGLAGAKVVIGAWGTCGPARVLAVL